MRPTKLITAVAAAASVLALAPAGALAAGGHSNANAPGCHVSLSADPHVATSGEAVSIAGVLRCSGATNVVGQTVTVYEKSAGVPGFKAIATPTTTAGGIYTVTPAPAVLTDSTFYARALNAQSLNHTVRVAPLVSVTSVSVNGVAVPTGSTLLTGRKNAVTVKGTVNPIDQGAEVLLQREFSTTSEEWATIQGKATVKFDGTFSITHTFGLPGDANLRVLVRPHHRFDVRGVSESLSYVVSQAQNPDLTLEPSSDPVEFGKTLTFKGVLKAGANQKVTIVSHSAGMPFTPLTEVTTGANGAYEFTVQSAEKNTQYQARSGATKSAIVFEGVRWVVTAGAFTEPGKAPASKVASNTPVTFSGTAMPARVGHFVYLERKNASGNGWHVVDQGTVAAPGVFSITHNVVGSGKEIYRIKVPGDPENQGGFSTPMEIEVTPAAAVIVPQKQPILPH